MDLIGGQPQGEGDGRPLPWGPGGYDAEKVGGKGCGLQTSAVPVSKHKAWGPDNTTISSNYFKIDDTMVSSAIAGVEIFLRCIDTTFPSKQSYLVQRMDPPHC